MEEVVILLLHNKVPVKLPAVNVEFPQLLVTETDGAVKIVFGAAVAEATLLIHPLAVVCVTVYDPAVDTVIAAVVAELLHNKDPVKPLAVSTVLPQLSETVIEGVAGTTLGFAAAEPLGLLHPLTN